MLEGRGTIEPFFMLFVAEIALHDPESTILLPIGFFEVDEELFFGKNLTGGFACSDLLGHPNFFLFVIHVSRFLHDVLLFNLIQFCLGLDFLELIVLALMNVPDVHDGAIGHQFGQDRLQNGLVGLEELTLQS
jgi:hypothetical protein